MKGANLKMLHTKLPQTFWEMQKYKSGKIVSDAEGYEGGRDEPVNRVDFQGSKPTRHHTFSKFC